MDTFQRVLQVMNESGGDRDAFIKAYQARLAKGNAQPTPTEPTPARKGDTWTRVMASIVVEAERATEAQRRWQADRDLDQRLHARAVAEAEAKKRTIAPVRQVVVQASLNEPKKTGRGNAELRELRESVNLGHLVGLRE